jgi:hypothetical protein
MGRQDGAEKAPLRIRRLKGRAEYNFGNLKISQKAYERRICYIR